MKKRSIIVKRTSKIRIGEGKPLGILEYLGGRFTYRDAAGWAGEIAAGRIIVNGVAATAATVLRCGDEMEYLPEARPEPEVDETVTVVHEDDDFLALCKSGNLPCHPAGIFFNRTLWAMLKEGRVRGVAPLEEIHFVNRLDRETSGLVLVAKNKRAAKTAARAMAREEACKEYWVVVEGEFPDELSAEGWLRQEETAVRNGSACGCGGCGDGFDVVPLFATRQRPVVAASHAWNGADASDTGDAVFIGISRRR